MGTYATTEAALLVVVRSYSSGSVFTTANSSRGDWSVLDAQGTEASAVIAMAGPTLEADRFDTRGSQGKRQERHDIAIDVYYKRGVGAGGDGITYVALTTLTDALRSHINRYPDLSGATGVHRAEVLQATEPTPTTKGAHLMQSILMRVWCQFDPLLLESAG